METIFVFVLLPIISPPKLRNAPLMLWLAPVLFLPRQVKMSARNVPVFMIRSLWIPVDTFTLSSPLTPQSPSSYVVCWLWSASASTLHHPHPTHTHTQPLEPSASLVQVWRNVECLSSRPPSLEIRTTHAPPPPLFIPFQTMPPKSCCIFIWAWWLWQIGQMTHIHRHTRRGTSLRGGVGRPVRPGRDQSSSGLRL